MFYDVEIRPGSNPGLLKRFGWAKVVSYRASFGKPKLGIFPECSEFGYPYPASRLTYQTPIQPKASAYVIREKANKMNAAEPLILAASGENSRVQFKENVTNAVSIAQKMVAFSNSKGGVLLIGINDKTGAVTGLSFADVQRINNLLTTAANEHIKSATGLAQYRIPAFSGSGAV
ncbi:MAG: ATP-binding protein [Saprospiraceae bacterium]|nr:ATP-binding protein [Saprospiraceae bacterium]MDZ4704593.1 ATP-binding protein [Saprospiraceae bacterium]